MSPRPTIRAAIYTRKSSEEGLEQEFNSLDAQYEACAAYIASQKHEGWTAVPARFDDGGVSGGTLERPALQRLFADVDAGRIDLIVVYKIDRLTRSLADFARLVDRLDKVGASFVSVTQAFNTSTSMGRLTLNVLLSFAQFEREVTAERIRDKIASSKQKGMWMGGTIPLGYDRHLDPQRRELVQNESEAKTVLALFDLYDRLGGIGAVADEAARLGLRSKRHETASGQRRGGGVFTKGQLHYLLTNPTYIGLVRHKDRTFPGLHPAIIPRELWDRVQARLLSAGARPRRSEQGTTDGVAGLASTLAGSAAPGRVRLDGSVGASAALLGKLVDETGDRLTPSRTAARGRSYLYYVSNRLIAGGLDPSGWRLPAPALEREVARRIATHLRAAAGRHEILAEADARSAVALAARAEALATNIERAPAALLPTLVACGTIHSGEMQLTLDAGALAETLGVSAAALDPGLLSTAFRFALRRRGIETKLVVGEHVPLPDRNLQRALLEAHREMALRRDGRRRAETPDSAAISGSRTRRRSYLAFLSPRIQQAILAGEVPEGLTLEVILRQDLPLDWNEQARLFGFTADSG